MEECFNQGPKTLNNNGENYSVGRGLTFEVFCVFRRGERQKRGLLGAK